VKNTIPFVFVSAGLITSLYAGDVMSTTPSTSDCTQKLFGAPCLDFGRRQADSDLPGYPVVWSNYNHTFNGDFDSLPGDVSSDQFTLFAPVLPLNFNDSHIFAFLQYKATKYNTTGPENAVMLPEDTLSEINLPIVFLHDSPDNWLWGAMVMPSYAGSSSSSDNFTFSAAVGAGYSWSSNLTLFAGAYYSEDYGDDFVIPGVAFIWRPAPRWEVYLLGPIGGVSYSVNESMTLSFYGQYNSPTWYVKADGSGPDRNVSMSSLDLGLKAEWNLNSMLWGYVAGGYAVARELEVDNTDNSRIQKSDIDPSPFVEVGLDLRF
jgi:hypothetical protein